MTRTGAGRSTPRYYFSLRSPYSWLAHRDLRGSLRDVAERVEWIPFWEPDELSERLLNEAGGEFIYSPMSRAKHFYILQDVRRLAVRRGLRMTWPIDREPCWEVPHLAYFVARDHGLGAQFVDRAYRARWEEGLDICDRNTMAAIGADLGLDPAELRDAADDPMRRGEGVAALLAVQRDGVFGVPFFVNGFDKYWGVDRLGEFCTAVRESAVGEPALPEERDEPRSAAMALAQTADDGHAGGCG